MKKSLSIILILFFLSITLLSFSEEVKVHQLTGTIQSIDLKEKKVDVKGLRGEIICELTDATKIRISGESASVTDLKKGDKVVCKYTDDDSGIKCKSITLIDKKEAKN
ncbi:MAG: hypothetical protein D6734_07910 [Candidatus Schekmanbacteria bacterium]|nr:MAG: hypothetical protein D6734_07910 [Candidatus Schekmanbacteria bacterium]